MGSIFKKIIDIICAVIILFLFPLMYLHHNNNTILIQTTNSYTVNLVEAVSTNGYITKNMYEQFLSKLATTNLIYEINLCHKERILEPEYRFKSIDEIIDEQEDAWEGENYYTYVPVFTQREEVIDDEQNDDLNMNTESNESIIGKSINQPKDPNHIHTDACYVGQKHTHSYYGGSCYTYYDDREWVEHNHLSSCYHTHSSIYGSCYRVESCGSTRAVYSRTDNGNYGSTQCPTCETEVYDGYVDRYICGDCGSSMGAIYYNITTYHCGNLLRRGSGTTNSVSSSCSSSRRNLVCTISTTEAICGLTGGWQGSTGYYLSCQKEQGRYYLNNTRVNESCHQLVLTMIPTHPIQKVYLNEALITTATLTFRDGSTKVIICNSNFSPNILVTNKTVTLSYSQTIYGLIRESTCNTQVTVIPRTKLCSNGHSYKLKSDGSDPGCPFCAAWLSKLEVYYPASREIVIFKGTTLEQNGVILQATYMNGRTERLTSGYANNLDANYVGFQTVTVSYKGMYNTIKVTTKRNLKKCITCGKFYELMPDNADPSCPFCKALIPIFTGNILSYYTMNYGTTILETLNQNKPYYMKEGDYFSVSIRDIRENSNKNDVVMKAYKKSYPSIKINIGDKIRDLNDN